MTTNGQVPVVVPATPTTHETENRSQLGTDENGSQHVPERACGGCGCTDDHSCPEGCWWVEKGPRPLCSSCTNPDYGDDLT